MPSVLSRYLEHVDNAGVSSGQASVVGLVYSAYTK